MQIVQMLGFSAFIATAWVLGGRLLLLWRRTREVPELAMGLSFLVGGALGYSCWFVYSLVRMGRVPGDPHDVATVGLALSCLGALTNAAGIRAAFRPGDSRALGLLVVFAALMAIGWGDTFRNASGHERWTFWLAMGTAGASYLWSTGECLRLYVVLGKRARFGLASPLLVDRARLWTVAFAAVVAMVASSLAARAVFGPDGMPPAWVSTFQSLCGLACAAAIWFGFFPPAFYRRRFEGQPEASV
ncbi:MAG TPA: hypothetical protein VKB65_06335 [Myxococcota bacterium]|nr:hypothetical protein [Myxococcota bacterium]